MDRQYKVIATAPGEPDIIVELSEAEYADYYERLNNPRKPKLTGGILVGFLRDLFKTKPLSYRVTILKEVYPILDIVERDLQITESDYNEFVALLEQVVMGVMPIEDITTILKVTNEFIQGYEFYL